ncbi:MAG: ATP-binding region ATPase domain protein [Gemmatimonadetes bacterium]|nr:ATP-binding region ATPase domain protein [Gemmatimonadota bacterium]
MRFPRNSLFWLLAAALGATTLWSSVSLMHDTTQARELVVQVSASVLHDVVMLTESRVEALALESAARCATRDLRRAPGMACVHYDVRAGTLDSGGAPLSAILKAEAARRRGDRPTVRLVTDSSLGENAALTVVRHDDAGTATAVDGIIMPRAHLMDALFREGPLAAALFDAPLSLAQLDSGSLRVSDVQGRTLFGVIQPFNRFRTSARGTGALDGIGFTVGLSGWSVPVANQGRVPLPTLWHNGILILSTILMVVVAAVSTRRELLLARARSDFIAGVSHDLRMPLAQVLLAGETLALQRERDAGQRVTLASSIVREARRLMGLVDNVLLYSRTGAVKLEPQRDDVSLDALFSDVVESVELAVQDAGQQLATDASPVPAVIGDRSLLRQAIVNLVDNAVKYGPRGQQVTLSALRTDGGRVHITVDDHGPGVPIADRARVFAPYARLAHDQVSERTGTGLGLAVVQQVVTAMQGRVWLEDAPGGGTRAVIELPEGKP